MSHIILETAVEKASNVIAKIALAKGTVIESLESQVDLEQGQDLNVDRNMEGQNPNEIYNKLQKELEKEPDEDAEHQKYLEFLKV